MTCGEVREYLFAFLDSELDAPLSIELQRHLDICPHCACEAEIERTVRRHLAAALDDQARHVAFDERALMPMFRPAARGRFRFAALGRGRTLFTGLAACILLVLAIWLAARRGQSVQHPDSFADLLVADFEHFLEQGEPLQLASAEPERVSAWLRQKTGFDVSMPSTAARHCVLLGGRKCELAGQLAAFALYKVGDVPASLVVTRSERMDLEKMQRREHAGRSHWVDRCKGHTVVACQRGELLYAVVSTLPEKELLCLMPEPAHESD